jgi:hypothetical protein
LELIDCFDVKHGHPEYEAALKKYHQPDSKIDHIHLEVDRCNNFPPSNGSSGSASSSGSGSGVSGSGGGGGGGGGGNGGNSKSKTSEATSTGTTALTAANTVSVTTVAGSNISSSTSSSTDTKQNDDDVIWLESGAVSLTPLPNESYFDYLYRTGVSNTGLWRDGDESIEIDESRLPRSMEEVDSLPKYADPDVLEPSYYGETMAQYYQRTGIENSGLWTSDTPNLASLAVRIPPPYAAQTDALYFVAESAEDKKHSEPKTSQLHTVGVFFFLFGSDKTTQIYGIFVFAYVHSIP